ncbi:valine--tRNA ligase [Neolewinella lacunae]|uniref:Valine--tRNA ligase n=1 Tax=Neolewinella lacunae TaxID=1517758 RepID=A0A923PJT9_9BACT|nr:valine--tRNA ligase [Neolewinella lacunae]MBC6993031.1 valine--tRNA ligase [Neolewinella lacunae]MDN3635853.1 valine--tRNA ligase [Neolewinella lacunae]
MPAPEGNRTPQAYSAADVEHKWYQHWLAKNYFHSEPDEREPFTIVIPPPNVTGVLHMGHMLNNTIQDILIRKARLDGRNACWVPGTDHASIATEAKVVQRLREKGIKKSDLTREEFLAHAFEWKEEFGGIILQQLQELGASCDWQRTRFTMEPELYRAVIKVFVSLYRKDKMYRGLRMTNWDPEAQTVLSNEEVIYTDENSNLYHVRYKVAGTDDEYITIATQRPETIMADTGLAVSPTDERYLRYHGRQVIVPLVNRPIPIITDDYVDPEFGTGALKVTPAHDPNDYALGEKYGLEVIDILTPDGKLNEFAQVGVGLDRFEARTEIVKLLKASGDLVATTQYRTRIGRSERTNAVVEPRLTLQWFLRMDDLAATALGAVESGEVRFHPPNMVNMYRNWLTPENVRDWCVSRQLWWGQRIPAWYWKDEVFVAETAAEALAQAQQAHPEANLQLEDLQQDEDVLDTWFSSWLWPLSVFDGWKDTRELQYYYPTSDLVTGWDIMFFWVARMVMAGYEFSEDLLGKDFVEKNGRMPFRNVYFTGMVRDEKRRKMSKSLGNSPDALELLKTYGADGVRFGMMSSAAAGNDIVFDAPIDPQTQKVLNTSELCDQGKKFCNKIFNANRLLQGFTVSDRAPDALELLAAEWLLAKLNETTGEVDRMLGEYRISEALRTLYNFIWGDFCSWYLEAIKPADGVISRDTYEATVSAFERMMTLLHPFLPFITEEVWHGLRERREGEDCVVSTWPKVEDFDAALIQSFTLLQETVSHIRYIRSQREIAPREPLQLFVEHSPASEALLGANAGNSPGGFRGAREFLQKSGVLSAVALTDAAPDNALPFLFGNDTAYLVLNETIDQAAERAKMQAELDRLRGFLAGIEKKLSNERFVANAPEEVITLERKKQADATAKIASLERILRVNA